jgi:MFS family permease
MPIVQPTARESLLESVPLLEAGRTMQLVVLTFILTVAIYAKSAISPLQETMRLALHLSDNQIALLQGPALAWPTMLIAIPLGLMVDRRSRVRILLVLVVLITIGSILTAHAANFALLLAARGLVGLATFAISPAVLSLLADMYPPEQRGRAGMVTTIGSFIGVAAVFAIGGQLAATAAPGPQGWQSAMFWLTVPLLCLTVLLLPSLREPPRTGQVIENSSTRESLREFWKFRALILPPLVGVAFAEVALGGVMIWAAPSFSRSFDLAADRVGAIMAFALPLGGIIGTIAGGVLADVCQRRGGPRRTLAVVAILALASAPPAFFSLAPTVTLASILLVVLTAALTTVVCMGVTLFTVVIPNELRGLCTGLLMGFGASIAFGVAPLLVSLLSGALGGEANIGLSLAIVCTGGCVICTSMCLTARSRAPSSVPQ